MSQPVPWVPPVLYGAVLAGGLYYAVIGTGLTLRTVVFACLLVVLIAVEAHAAMHARTTSPRRAGAALALRVVAYCVVTAVDVSGLSRVLFVLVPFLGYFAFGRRVAVMLGAGCTAGVAGAFAVTVPHWWNKAEYISDLLMFGLGIVLATTMAAVADRERRAQQRVAELSVAQERNRMAREIHDSLGHHLTAIGVQLETAEAFAPHDLQRAAKAVAHARSSATQALEEVRASVRALEDEPVDLAEALAGLVRRLDTGGPSITLTVTGLQRRSLLVLYRAAQEGLANACRHADATQIAVALTYDEHGARLKITDNGRGFAGAPEGFGLRGLKERARLVNGTLDITTSDAGTVLEVSVPW
jgi:signal transduction histidine kinase